jgi:hypothetical protein
MPKKEARTKPPSQAVIYSTVPQWCIDRIGCDATGLLVLHTLGRYRRKSDGYCYPSQATIAAMSFLGERTVRTTLHRLVKCGALRVVRKATGTFPALYAMPDREWTGNSSGAIDTPEPAMDRQFLQNGPAETADELTTELTTRTTTERPSAFAVQAHAMRARAVYGASARDSRRDPNQRPDLRVVA